MSYKSCPLSRSPKLRMDIEKILKIQTIKNIENIAKIENIEQL